MFSYVYLENCVLGIGYQGYWLGNGELGFFKLGERGIGVFKVGEQGIRPPFHPPHQTYVRSKLLLMSDGHYLLSFFSL